MYQLEPNVCFNEENGLNDFLISVNERWRDRHLPLRHLQFVNGHYDSLEQQIQNSYEMNTGVILFATLEKIFCIIEDIERIALEYGYEFKKVFGINLYSIHFTTHTIYYLTSSPP